MYKRQPEDRVYLADMLILGKTSEALDFIKKILLDNLRNNVSDEQLVMLSKKIIGILLKVIRTRNIDFDTGKESDEKFIDELAEDRVENVLAVINNMIKEIEKKNNETDKVDIHTVVLLSLIHI